MLSALQDFLVARGPQEVQAFLGKQYKKNQSSFPERAGQSPAEYVDKVVDTLKRHGMVDYELFLGLVCEWPAHVHEVVALMRTIQSTPETIQRIEQAAKVLARGRAVAAKGPSKARRTRVVSVVAAAISVCVVAVAFVASHSVGAAAAEEHADRLENAYGEVEAVWKAQQMRSDATIERLETELKECQQARLNCREIAADLGEEHLRNKELRRRTEAAYMGTEDPAPLQEGPANGGVEAPVASPGAGDEHGGPRGATLAAALEPPAAPGPVDAPVVEGSVEPRVAAAPTEPVASGGNTGPAMATTPVAPRTKSRRVARAMTEAEFSASVRRKYASACPSQVQDPTPVTVRFVRSDRAAGGVAVEVNPDIGKLRKTAFTRCVEQAVLDAVMRKDGGDTAVLEGELLTVWFGPQTGGAP